MNAAELPIDAKEFDGTAIKEPQLAAAQRALNAQLKHTALLIDVALTTHPHFTDDCGEYLRGALELSAELMSARENGLEELPAAFEHLAKTHPSDPEGGMTYFDEVPSDSSAKDLREYMESIGWKERY